MFARLRRRLGATGRSRNHHLFECRQCGTAVDSTASTCPRCGSSEIAHYEL